ncbi:MAG: transglycosylase SLT domain-containing protein, partial [Proteobacteria bacterium]|nr:transglycosylase SLT domain-containing protein [Pseudomonadota bacterium]
MTALMLAMIVGTGIGPPCGPYLNSLTLPPKAFQSPATRRRFRTKFDHHFSRYGKRYWGPTFDWRLLKAQAWAESRLREKVIARDGGQGIAQFMPATARWVSKMARVPNKPLTAKWGIAMQAVYL